MKNVISTYRGQRPSQAQTISELTALYNNVTLRLLECATYRSVGDEAQDEAVETLEEELQELQEQTLRASAKITVRNKDDLKRLLDLWYVSTVENSGSEMTVSDRIIMNIRDYFEEVVVTDLVA